MKVFGFDVDNTIVDSGKRFSEWVTQEQWYLDYFDSKEMAHNLAFSSYQLSGYNFFHPKHKRLMNEWWKNDQLYDDMEVTEEAKFIIDLLLSSGNKVIFVSHIEGNHGKSKFDMIARSIKDFDGFIATREKNFIRCDYLIDDRAYNLFSLDKSTQGIYVQTRYLDETLSMIDVPQVRFESLGSDLCEVLGINS